MGRWRPAEWISDRLRRSHPIGLDFGEDRVSWVQLERSGESWRVRDARIVRYGGGLEELLDSKAGLGEMAQDVLSRGRFRGHCVVTHAPSEELRVMVLNYEEDLGQSQDAQILGLAQERMQDDLSSHVVDYLPIRTGGDGRGERSAMVAVIPEKPVIERLEALRRAGLEVSALEIAPSAVRRLVIGDMAARRTERTDELALALQIGSKKTEFTLLWGRRLLLYRQLEVGTESMEEAVSRHLDCDSSAATDLLHSYGVSARPLEASGDDSAGAGEFDPDEVAAFAAESEIAHSLREIVKPELKRIVEQAHKAISYAAFQTHGMTIDSIHLIESHFECRGLAGLLEEMLQVPVSKLAPLAHFDRAPQLDGIEFDPRITLALGFGLRGAVDA